jgi:PAS domain S-box-containing protein
MQGGERAGLAEIKIAIIYILVGGLWIAFSDQLLRFFVGDVDVITKLQTYKGWLFIGVTGVLLFVLISNRAAELRHSQGALQESERSLAALISNLPGIAFRCKNDRLWTMELISDGCLGLTGYTSDELLMNRKVAFIDLIHADDRTGVWEEVQSALRVKRPYQLTYRIRTALGEEKGLWEQGRGIYDAAGELAALEGLISDITALRSLESRYEARKNAHV